MQWDGRQKTAAFTIVELLIVVVVIAILATITVVAYNGITRQAKNAAIQTDLSQIIKKFEAYKITAGAYPTGDAEQALASVGFAGSLDATYSYSVAGPHYCVGVVVETEHYFAADTIGEPVAGRCYGNPTLNPQLNCPTGFIQVPGDFRYGTKDFCVMKYEAKNNGSNGAVSQATGLPWTSIDHPGAVAAARTACATCQLITDRQWMTIAANVMSVASNWSSGSVGGGFIYKGHVNGSPGSALAASTNDASGTHGFTGGTGNSPQHNNRRTLTLTNGQVIWDISGNVLEWVDASVTGPQPGPSTGEFVTRNYNLSSGWNWRGFDYLNPALIESSLPGASGFSSTNGIGTISTHPDSTGSFPFLRGGHWSNTLDAGVLRLNTNNTFDNVSTHIGFRVASPGL